jgi:hypothetical protein
MWHHGDHDRDDPALAAPKFTGWFRPSPAHDWQCAVPDAGSAAAAWQQLLALGLGSGDLMVMAADRPPDGPRPGRGRELA